MSLPPFVAVIRIPSTPPLVEKFEFHPWFFHRLLTRYLKIIDRWIFFLGGGMEDVVPSFFSPDEEIVPTRTLVLVQEVRSARQPTGDIVVGYRLPVDIIEVGIFRIDAG